MMAANIKQYKLEIKWRNVSSYCAISCNYHKTPTDVFQQFSYNIKHNTKDQKNNLHHTFVNDKHKYANKIKI